MEAESETRKLHALRLSLLSAALDALPTLRTLPGVRAIPFVQVKTSQYLLHDSKSVLWLSLVQLKKSTILHF